MLIVPCVLLAKSVSHIVMSVNYGRRAWCASLEAETHSTSSGQEHTSFVCIISNSRFQEFDSIS